MGSFKSFGKKGFSGGNRDFNGNQGNRPKALMHQATCASCGKQCQVPFKPTGDRPVYCKECFATHRNDNPRKEGSRFSKPHFEGAQPKPQNNNQFNDQFASLNAKLDKILQALTQKATPIVATEDTEKKAVEKVKKTKTKTTSKKTAKGKKK